MMAFFGSTVLALIMGNAQAGVRTDAFAFTDGSTTTPVISIYTSSPFGGETDFAFETFAMATPGWGQAYGGLSWQPTNWATLLGGVGVETISESSLRYAGWLMLYPTDRIFLLSIYEGGGSGHWWKGIYTYTLPMLGDHLVVGGMVQRYEGAGPRIEAKFGNCTIYVAPLWGRAGQAAIINYHAGIAVHF